MRWFDQKGIHQGKPEELERTSNHKNRRNVAILFHKVELIKSTQLSKKQAEKHLSISVWFLILYLADSSW